MNKIKLLKITSLSIIMCFLLGVTLYEIKLSHQKDLDSDFRKELARDAGEISFLYSHNERLEEVRSENPGAIDEYIEILLKMREEKIRKYLNDNPHTTISLAETVRWQNDFTEGLRELKAQ